MNPPPNQFSNGQPPAPGQQQQQFHQQQQQPPRGMGAPPPQFQQQQQQQAPRGMAPPPQFQQQQQQQPPRGQGAPPPQFQSQQQQAPPRGMGAPPVGQQQQRQPPPQQFNAQPRPAGMQAAQPPRGAGMPPQQQQQPPRVGPPAMGGPPTSTVPPQAGGMPNMSGLNLGPRGASSAQPGQPPRPMAGQPPRPMAGQPPRPMAGQPPRPMAGQPPRPMTGQPPPQQNFQQQQQQPPSGPPGPGSFQSAPHGQQQPRGPPQAQGFSSQQGQPQRQGGFQQPQQQGMQQQQQQQQQPGMQQQQQPGQTSFMFDPALQAPDIFMRTTTTKFPGSFELAKQAKVPLGAIVQPLAENPDGSDIDIVNFGALGVQRCRSCRAYINAFVQWIESGRRWRCNLCGLANDTPSQYYSHLDSSGRRVDAVERPELRGGVYEIVAPADYMVRAPQSPVYVFVIDVSADSVARGVLQVSVDAIKACLDSLPGAGRTQVAFVTFDSSIHFYNLRASLCEPQMLVVSDIDEMFVPIPEDLLVNLRESREVIDQLLDSLPEMHSGGQTVAASETALGVALDAACKIMFHIGGKMCVFQSKLPVLGDGKLKNREKKGVVGSDKEHGFLAPADNVYKSKALKYLRQQICVELFLMPVQYCDVASLQVLPKYTSGQLHYFPGFHAGKDGSALYSTICRSLCRNTGWEAVMRVRASQGVKVASSTFYGNFVIRGSDLLSLPNCDADAAFGVEFTHEDPQLKTGVVTFQTALLYTTSLGERRIRVITKSVPVTSSAADLLTSADQEAICMLQAKKSVDTVFKMGFEHARKAFQMLTMDLIRSTRSNFMGNNGLGPYGAGGGNNGAVGGGHERPPLPPNLELVPLYTMALLKSPIFRGGTDMPLDLRSFYLHQAARMPMDVGMRVMYPHLFGIHDMPDDCGRLVAVPTDEEGNVLPRNKDEAGLYRVDGQRVKAPKPKNLSASVLSPEACYLLDCGVVMYMWMGRGVNPALLTSLFGVASLAEVDTNTLQLSSAGDKDDEMKTRVLNIIKGLQASRGHHPRMVFVKEGDRHESVFYSHLVEDRATFAGGNLNYGEYFQGALRMAQSSGGY